MGDIAESVWLGGDASPVTHHFFKEAGPWQLNKNSVLVDFGSGFGNLCQGLSLQASLCGFQPRGILHVEAVGSYLAVDAQLLQTYRQESCEEGAVP